MMLIVLSFLACTTYQNSSEDSSEFTGAVNDAGITPPTVGGLFADDFIGMVAATNTPDNSNPEQPVGARGDGFGFGGGWDTTQLTLMPYLDANTGMAKAFGQTFDPGEYLWNCAAPSATADSGQGWCLGNENGDRTYVIKIRECGEDKYDYCVGWNDNGDVYRPECGLIYTPPESCPDSYVE